MGKRNRINTPIISGTSSPTTFTPAQNPLKSPANANHRVCKVRRHASKVPKAAKLYRMTPASSEIVPKI